jgi:membrane protein
MIAWAWIKEIGSEFIEDRAPEQAAALAFYAVLSMAPLLVIAIGVAGLVFGREAAENAIVTEFRGALGPGVAEMVQEVVKRSSVEPSRGIAAIVFGMVMLIVGAIGVFGQIKSALNTMWNVTPRPGRGLWGLIRDRLLSFAMVLCIGFLLLVSLAVSAVIAGAMGRFGDRLPMADWAAALLHFGASVVVITGLFGAIYKILPDARISWHDVALGALITSMLFSAGKFLIGVYLARASIVSAFGAAGSLVMILLWVYYSAILFLVGAEFTQVYARRRGSRIVPSAHAMWAPGSDPRVTAGRERPEGHRPAVQA